MKRDFLKPSTEAIGKAVLKSLLFSRTSKPLAFNRLIRAL